MVAAITAKIVRRHPHVFGDEAAAGDAGEVLANWDRIKADERAEKQQGLLDTVPHALPALMLAQTISRKAVVGGLRVGDARRRVG